MLHNTTRQNQAAHLKSSFFFQVLHPEIFLESAKLLLPHLIPPVENQPLTQVYLSFMLIRYVTFRAICPLQKNNKGKPVGLD